MSGKPLGGGDTWGAPVLCGREALWDDGVDQSASRRDPASKPRHSECAMTGTPSVKRAGPLPAQGRGAPQHASLHLDRI
eukprot:4501065-Prymnesium_polylepis.1